MYEPKKGTFPASVVTFFRFNVDEELTVDEMATKFDCSRANIHTQLTRALDARVLKRERDELGEWVYTAGPEIKPEAMNPSMIATPAKKKRVRSSGPTAIVVSDLRIVDDPVPVKMRTVVNKYLSLFSALKPGQAIRCRPGDVGKIMFALRKWIKASDLPYTTKSMMRHPSDDMGRVWMLAKGDEDAT